MDWIGLCIQNIWAICIKLFNTNWRGFVWSPSKEKRIYGDIAYHVNVHTHMLTCTRTLDCSLTLTRPKLKSSHSGESPYDSDKPRDLEKLRTLLMKMFLLESSTQAGVYKVLLLLVLGGSLPLIWMHTRALKTYLLGGYLPC